MSNSKTALQFTVVFFSTILVFLFLFISPTYSQTAEELEDIINQKEEELNKQKSYLSEIEKRIKEISGSNYSLTEKVNLLNAEITKLQKEIDKRNTEIEEKLRIIAEKETLLQKKKESLDLVSSQLYMKSRYNEGQLFFSFSNLDEMLQTIFVKKNAIDILKDDIQKITGEFVNLVELKESLEKEKQDLDTQKQDLDKSYQLVLAEKKKVQAELNAQIATKGSVTRRINGLTATLSDLQYQLLISRQGGTYVNPDSIPASSGITSLRGFLDQAPAGSFGVFSFGAYTHRDGMSQWGARARADGAGNNPKQDYLTILKAYYLNSGYSFVTGYPEPATIRVKGNGKSCFIQGYDKYGNPIYDKYYDTEMSFSEYMKKIYEMPASWSKEALKAQAVASRSFAIYKVLTQGYIIPNESNQVSKDCDNASGWTTAVSETQGQVVTTTLQYPSYTGPYARYAAVHGGWGSLVGWDTTDGTGNGDWMSRAWDSLSGVSWFYRTWYGDTSQEGNGTCSRSPWLSQTEMADLVNVYQLWKASGGNDPRIYPVIDACHVNKGQYSYNEAKSLAAKPVTSISSVSVANSNGKTDSVIFVTNAGVITMTGNEFKTIYNLRAPGHLHIPQTGFVHINIHQK